MTAFTATWDQPDPDNVDGYWTQYKTDADSFKPENSEGYAFLGGASKFDVDVKGATYLTFRVKAHNKVGSSEWVSRTITINTQNVSPENPQNVQITVD